MVIIARSDLVIPAWQEAWPNAVRIASGATLPDAEAVLLLAGEPDWLTIAGHYSSRQIPVLVCSRAATLGELRQALQAGARGYLDLFSPADVLLRAVTTVQQGALWMPPVLLANLMNVVSNTLPEPADDPFCNLSEREQQVARAVVRGLTNKAVAKELAISERTVKLHLTSVFSKLGIGDRMQLLLLSRNPH